MRIELQKQVKKLQKQLRKAPLENRDRGVCGYSPTRLNVADFNESNFKGYRPTQLHQAHIKCEHITANTNA